MPSMGKVRAVLPAEVRLQLHTLHHVSDKLQHCVQVYPMCAQIEQHIKNVGLDKNLEEAVSKIFRERWDKMHSPLHAAAYMLEPQFGNAAFGREVCTFHSDALLEI